MEGPARREEVRGLIGLVRREFHGQEATGSKHARRLPNQSPERIETVHSAIERLAWFVVADLRSEFRDLRRPDVRRVGHDGVGGPGANADEKITAK